MNSFKDIAYQILKEAGKSLHYRGIVEIYCLFFYYLLMSLCFKWPILIFVLKLANIKTYE